MKIRTKVRGGGSTANDAGFELIDVITCEEDGGALILTTEPDGTPYNFKSVILKIDFANGIESGNHVVFIIDDKDKKIIGVAPYFGQTANRLFANYMFININGIMFVSYTDPKGQDVIGTPLMFGNPSKTGEKDNIVSSNIAKISITNAKNIKAGTKIYLYAVRA